MSIIEDAELEFSQLARDALVLQDEVSNIQESINTALDKFKDINQTIKQTSKPLAQLTNKVLTHTRYEAIAVPASAAAFVAVHVIGGIIEAIGKWRIEKRRREMLEKLLTTKKELAAEKRDLVERMLRRIQSSKGSIIKACNIESSRIINYTDSDRVTYYINGMKNIFESYFIIEHTDKVCLYLLSEFNAWMDGNQKGPNECPVSIEIYHECALQLVTSSLIPLKDGQSISLDSISIGAMLLLTDPILYNNCKKWCFYKLLTAGLLKKRTKSLLHYSESHSKEFNRFYKLHLVNNQSTYPYMIRSIEIMSIITISLVLFFVTFGIYYKMYISPKKTLSYANYSIQDINDSVVQHVDETLSSKNDNIATLDTQYSSNNKSDMQQSEHSNANYDYLESYQKLKDGRALAPIETPSDQTNEINKINKLKDNFSQSDKELNDLYRLIINRSNSYQKKIIKHEETQWIKYKESTCSKEAGLIGEATSYIWTATNLKCLIRNTNERILELKKQYGQQLKDNYNMTSEMDVELNKLISRYYALLSNKKLDELSLTYSINRRYLIRKDFLNQYNRRTEYYRLDRIYNTKQESNGFINTQAEVFWKKKGSLEERIHIEFNVIRENGDLKIWDLLTRKD